MDAVKQILNQKISENMFLDIDTLRKLGMPADELAAEIVNFMSNGNLKGMMQVEKDAWISIKTRMQKEIEPIMIENNFCPECTHDHKEADQILYDVEKGISTCRCGYDM